MALTYPLVFSRLMDIIEPEVSSVRFSLSDPRQFNQTGGGEILDASLGSRLWTGEYSMVPKGHQELLQIEGRIELLLEPGASFLVYDTRKKYPAGDITGAILGASTPTLSAVNANNVDVTLTGLPPGYAFTRGDMFSFTYGSAPLRYALHRVTFAASAADGSGNITVQVVPPIRSGYTLGTAVSLVQPKMKAKIIPASYQPSMGSPGKLSDGLSFQFTQTLR